MDRMNTYSAHGNGVGHDDETRFAPKNCTFNLGDTNANKATLRIPLVGDSSCLYLVARRMADIV